MFLKRAERASKRVRLFCVVRREAELHFAMRHPNIVEVFGYSASSPVCLIMERMNQTLSDFLGLDLTIAFADKMSILEGVAKVSRLPDNRFCGKDFNSRWSGRGGHIDLSV